MSKEEQQIQDGAIHFDQYYVPSELRYRQQSSHEVWSYIRKLEIPRSVGVGSWASHVCIICSVEKKMALQGEELYHKCLLSCGNTSNANAHMERRHKEHEYTKKYIANRGLFYRRKGIKKAADLKLLDKSIYTPLKKKVKKQITGEYLCQDNSTSGSFELWQNQSVTDFEKSPWADRSLVRDFYDSQIVGFDDDSVMVLDSGGNLRSKSTNGEILGMHIFLQSPESAEYTLSSIGTMKYALLSCENWSAISAEGILSAVSSGTTSLIFEISSVEQIQEILLSFNIGVSGFLLPNDQEIICAAMNVKSSRCLSVPVSNIRDNTIMEDDINLVEALITSVVSVGLGDKVCIDLIQLLEDGEGVLVGSSNKLLAFVQGETVDMGVVSRRPFRINAGAVHSHILMADSSMKYLSEIRPGDQIRVVKYLQDSSKSEYEISSRAVGVGRCNIEPQPLLMVTFEALQSQETTGQVFLQKSDTVKLLSSRDRSISVVNVRAGDAILVLSLSLIEKANGVMQEVAEL